MSFQTTVCGVSWRRLNSDECTHVCILERGHSGPHQCKHIEKWGEAYNTKLGGKSQERREQLLGMTPSDRGKAVSKK